MEYVKGKIEGKPKKLEVVLFGDWHIGHPACDMELIKRTINYVKKNKCRALIMGDLLECGTKVSVGSGVYDQVMPPQAQMDLVIELLEPIKDQIDGAINGNHEERIKKDTSIDVMKVICDRLGIKYIGYRGIVNYSWNKNSYPIMIWHGHGGGGTTATVERKLKSMTEVADDCAVYALGHFHKRLDFYGDIYRVDPFNHKLRLDRVLFICSNTALNVAEYAEMAGYKAGHTSQPILTLSGRFRDKSVKVRWIE